MVCTSDPTYTPLDERITLLFMEDGPAAKRNLIAARSRSPYLIYLDDDCEISPYTCYEFVRWMEEHPRCGMVFGKIYKMAEGRRRELDAAGSWITWTGFLWDRAGNQQRDHGQYDTPTRCLSSKSATCIVRRSTFHTVGGFDSTYYILGEETDLAWRVWLRGWEVWYVPTAVSWHAFGCESLKPRADYYTIRRTMTYGCRNYLSLLWTNLGTWKLTTILPTHVCAWIISAMGFAIRGDPKRAVAIMQGLYEALRRMSYLQRKRHYTQSTRVCSDRQLFPIICYSTGFSYYLKRLWRYWTTQLHG